MNTNQFFKITKQYVTIFILFFTSFGITIAVTAAENQSSTHISFGQYASSDGDDSVTGSSLTISFIAPITDLLSYYIKLGNGSASGTHTNEDNSTTKIKSSHTNLGSGIQINFDLSDENKYILFTGTGLIMQRYQYDFDYPDSKTGKTSGTGYGYTAYAGFKYRASRNFIIIPSYQYEQVTIKSEDGKRRNVTSAGTSLALAISF